MRDVLAFVLGGGGGTRLMPLTSYRSKPAVPLAGKYRLIDIPLSNCINSGIKHIYVLTQFMSVSLHRHIRQTYRFDPFNGGFVEILAAQQTIDSGTDWYQGTADAVRKNIRYLEQSGVEQVLILSGDQLYRMDYVEMLRTHVDSKADVTIAGLPVDRQTARSLGIMRIDDSGRVVGFLEKPQDDDEINMVAMNPKWFDEHGVESRGRECLASMGIYLFNRQVLVDVLKKTTYEDFGKEVFPAAIRARHVHVHLYDGYWEDIGTIRAFYNANLALARLNPQFELFEPDAPIYTRARFLPPTRMEGCTVAGSIVADGCRIGTGVVIENSVIGLRCEIGDDVTIRDSILMGADEYENRDELTADDDAGRPHIGVGSGSTIVGSIIDKNCRIGKNVSVVNEGQPSHADLSDGCLIRDGIAVLIKDSILPNGWTMDQPGW
jgi:glucose-1-phosphate adenylyltransferase